MKTLLTLAITLFPLASYATVTATSPWIRASTGPNGALFLELENDSTLLEAVVDASTSDALCDHMELHTHTHEADGTMRMRQVKSIDVPANAKAELKPGGLHIMLIGLKKPLQEGEVVPVTLTLDSGGTLEVDVPVKSAAGGHHP